MTPCPSLLIAQASRSLEWLGKIRFESEHTAQKYRAHLERLRVAINQFSREEELMSQIAEVIKFERARAIAAEAKVAELTKTQPDAEDAAQLALGQADIDAAAGPQGTLVEPPPAAEVASA